MKATLEFDMQLLIIKYLQERTVLIEYDHLRATLYRSHIIGT